MANIVKYKKIPKAFIRAVGELVIVVSSVRLACINRIKQIKCLRNEIFTYFSLLIHQIAGK